MNDNELDELKKILSPIRKIEPDELQLARWKRAVRRELGISTRRTWYAVAAGIAIGFLSATFYFEILPVFNHPAENLQANATQEWIFTKTE